MSDIPTDLRTLAKHTHIKETKELLEKAATRIDDLLLAYQLLMKKVDRIAPTTKHFEL